MSNFLILFSIWMNSCSPRLSVLTLKTLYMYFWLTQFQILSCAFKYVTHNVQPFLSSYLFVQQSLHNQILSTLTSVRKESLQKKYIHKVYIHSQCHWWPFLKWQNQKKKSIWGVVGLLFIVFFSFKIILSRFKSSLEKSCNNLPQLYFMGLEPNSWNNTI